MMRKNVGVPRIMLVAMSRSQMPISADCSARVRSSWLWRRASCSASRSSEAGASDGSDEGSIAQPRARAALVDGRLEREIMGTRAKHAWRGQAT